ncbi:MAG: hypothetical protein ACOX4P_00510 [Anaerovoracaceae bacterium]|jgi:uncharacterized membrane-anchored protein
MGNIIYVLTCCLCGVVFSGIGIYAYKKKTPMHFWSGTTVHSEEITDIKAYNRENAIMWIVYSLFFFLSGIMGLFDKTTFYAGILLILSCFPGIFVLILNYLRIERKYKVKYVQEKKNK